MDGFYKNLSIIGGFLLLFMTVDEADRIDDWLYLPEVLYAFMLIMVVSAGAGPYSLDALVLGLIDKHGA